MPHDIIVYSTPSCPYCHMAKDYLDSKNIAFTDKNVAIDEDASEEMVKKSGQMGVPVIEIDGKVIIGFDRGAIDELLK
ncbi:MAG: glutathione S-transferase N-terminal domain-containing protein [Candidatus Magasanikbacteria bacterium]|nr:glutathione S-transferase N-terminal domain-containing protein [Candidatus Magasanikbacteria bacterium]